MADSLTCQFCNATIRPPGGRVELVTHCPWCSADLRPTPPAPADAPPKGRPAAAPTRPRDGGPELVWSVLILTAAAVLAVGAFFAARALMLLAA